MINEFIDGNPVLSHVVRFKDRTEITDTDANTVKDGEVILWIVRTRCQPPSYHPIEKDGDERYRYNIQEVQAAAVLHGDLRDGAIAYLDDPTQRQGRFVFTAPTHAGEPLNQADTSTRRPVSGDPFVPATQAPQPLSDDDTFWHCQCGAKYFRGYVICPSCGQPRGGEQDNGP
jgi:hypothetical protein